MLSNILLGNLETKEKFLNIRINFDQKSVTFLPRLIASLFVKTTDESVRNNALFLLSVWLADYSKTARVVFKTPLKFLPKFVENYDKSPLNLSFFFFLLLKYCPELELPPNAICDPLKADTGKFLVYSLITDLIGTQNLHKNLIDLINLNSALDEKSIFHKMQKSFCEKETESFEKTMETYLNSQKAAFEMKKDNKKIAKNGKTDQIKNFVLALNEQRSRIKSLEEQNKVLTEENIKLRVEIKLNLQNKDRSDGSKSNEDLFVLVGEQDETIKKLKSEILLLKKGN